MESYITVMLQYINTSYDNNGNVAGKIPMTILLDAVNDVTVEESSNITAHPVVSGDMIADHMVREPASLTISGEISMNGSTNALIYPTKSSSTNRKPSLKYFQEIFKSIKDSASLCTISKLVSSTKEVRFLERENMALTSISWTERINSLGYRLTFKEVLTATTEVIPYTQVDENLPLQTNPNILSFSSSLMNWDAVMSYVIQYMTDAGLITQEFINHFVSFSQNPAAIAGAIGIAAGAAAVGVGVAGLTGVIGTGAAILGSTGPVGWIIGGGIAVLAGVYFLGKAIVSAIEDAKRNKKYKIEQFKLYQEDARQQQEDARFYNFTSNIYLTLTQSLDQRFFVYKIPSNEPQECYLSIGDEYYDFKFTKNNVSTVWNVSVTMPMRNENVIVANKSIGVAKSTFDQCTSSNPLFKASGSGAYVYLIYYPENLTEADIPAMTNVGGIASIIEQQQILTQESRLISSDKNRQKLNNYAILVCTMKPEDFNTVMQQLINDALLR